MLLLLPFINERRIVMVKIGPLKILDGIVITTDNDMTTDTEEVQEKLQNLSIYKSTGSDLLHPRILHALEEKLATPLSHIFNNSVET